MSNLRDEEIFKLLADAVVEMNEARSLELSKLVIERQLDAYDAIDRGLAAGMERAGQLFEEEEYFVPELLMCADAMYAGLEILKPYLKKLDHGDKKQVVIGVIEGDTHDIGKNLVRIMLETSGFEVHDLGRDIPPSRFVEKARDTGADIIAISTLMTTTMDGMAKVIEILNDQNIRDKHKVIVGGGPISQGFAERIGADGYSSNAAEAVRLARRLTEGAA